MSPNDTTVPPGSRAPSRRRSATGLARRSAQRGRSLLGRTWSHPECACAQPSARAIFSLWRVSEHRVADLGDCLGRLLAGRFDDAEEALRPNDSSPRRRPAVRRRGSDRLARQRLATTFRMRFEQQRIRVDPTAVTAAARQVQSRADGRVCHRGRFSGDALLNFPSEHSSGRASRATLSQPGHEARLPSRRPGVYAPVRCTTAQAQSPTRDGADRPGARSVQAALKQAGEPTATTGGRPCRGRRLTSVPTGQAPDALRGGKPHRRGA